MVSHGRDRKESKSRSQQPRRPKKKGAANGNDGDDVGCDRDHDDDDDVPDMDLLPDDYSILGGGSSVTSSNDAFLLEDDDYDGLDGGDGECDGGGRGEIERSPASSLRASRLHDALTLASTLT